MCALADFLARAWARLLFELSGLIYAISDPLDAAPLMPTTIDHEYFALLEEEGRP